MIEINNKLLDSLFAKAEESERLRMNYDLRTSAEDTLQTDVECVVARDGGADSST